MQRKHSPYQKSIIQLFKGANKSKIRRVCGDMQPRRKPCSYQRNWGDSPNFLPSPKMSEWAVLSSIAFLKLQEDPLLPEYQGNNIGKLVVDGGCDQIYFEIYVVEIVQSFVKLWIIFKKRACLRDLEKRLNTRHKFLPYGKDFECFGMHYRRMNIFF